MLSVASECVSRLEGGVAGRGGDVPLNRNKNEDCDAAKVIKKIIGGAIKTSGC